MNMGIIKKLGGASQWMSKLPAGLLFNQFEIGDGAEVLKRSAWEDEKQDIIERASWLCEKVIVEPDRLLKDMPAMLGPNYGGQWAIYSCSMLSAALANISVLYPETKDKCIAKVDKLVEMVLSSAIRHYDTTAWKEDALVTIKGNKSHMTYLSILAWVITNYKMMGGGDKYDSVLHNCCEALSRRMMNSKDLNLPSFPNGIIFFPDMMFAIVALRNYAKLYNGMYNNLVNEWVERAKNEWTHRGTGLIYSMLHPKWGARPPRGSYTALNNYCLTLIDEEFALDQYLKMKSVFRKDDPLCGVKEYLRKNPMFHFDPDAGPIICGISPSGTAFGIGSATCFEDWEFRNQMLRTAEIAGQTVKEKNKRHYRLGEFAIVGEATTLAMRTNIKR